MNHITKKLAATASTGGGAVRIGHRRAVGDGQCSAREPNCVAIYQTMSDSADMAQPRIRRATSAGGDSWMDIYWRASSNHDRYCH